MTKKVRVGVIGTSGWAENFYLANLKGYEGVELAAICGRNRTRAEELAGKYSVARVYTDYHEMVSSGELDAAIVVTPEDLHYPMVIVGPRHFIDAILNDTAISPNFHDGYQVQRVMEAALESAKSGCAVSLAKEYNTI